MTKDPLVFAHISKFEALGFDEAQGGMDIDDAFQIRQYKRLGEIFKDSDVIERFARKYQLLEGRDSKSAGGLVQAFSDLKFVPAPGDDHPDIKMLRLSGGKADDGIIDEEIVLIPLSLARTFNDIIGDVNLNEKTGFFQYGARSRVRQSPLGSHNLSKKRVYTLQSSRDPWPFYDSYRHRPFDSSRFLVSDKDRLKGLEQSKIANLNYIKSLEEEANTQLKEYNDIAEARIAEKAKIANFLNEARDRLLRQPDWMLYHKIGRDIPRATGYTLDEMADYYLDHGDWPPKKAEFSVSEWLGHSHAKPWKGKSKFGFGRGVGQKPSWGPGATAASYDHHAAGKKFDDAMKGTIKSIGHLGKDLVRDPGHLLKKLVRNPLTVLNYASPIQLGLSVVDAVKGIQLPVQADAPSFKVANPKEFGSARVAHTSGSPTGGTPRDGSPTGGALTGGVRHGPLSKNFGTGFNILSSKLSPLFKSENLGSTLQGAGLIMGGLGAYKDHRRLNKHIKANEAAYNKYVEDRRQAHEQDYAAQKAAWDKYVDDTEKYIANWDSLEKARWLQHKAEVNAAFDEAATHNEQVHNKWVREQEDEWNRLERDRLSPHYSRMRALSDVLKDKQNIERGQFRHGGDVSHPPVGHNIVKQPSFDGSGEIVGPGSGQEDNIYTDVRDRDYIIDASTVAALGDGSTSAGVQKLDDFVSQIGEGKIMPNQRPFVPVALSNGEYKIDGNVVAALGGGSNEEGAKQLRAMVKRVRLHKASNGDKLPKPAKDIMSYLRKR